MFSKKIVIGQSKCLLAQKEKRKPSYNSLSPLSPPQQGPMAPNPINK